MTKNAMKAGGDTERRSWMYGLNAGVLVVISLVVAGIVCYLTNTYNKHIDMTSNGLYSLSPETKAMLKQIDLGKETYTLVSIFRPSNTSEAQNQKGQQVTDLLEEYGRASSKIKIQDGGEQTLADLQKPIRDMYANELKPYEEATAKLDAMIADVNKFCTIEGANIGAMAQKPGTDSKTVAQAAQLQGLFGKQLPSELSQVQEEIKRQTDSTSPDWKQIVQTVQAVVDSVQTHFKEFTELTELKGQLTPSLLAYFQSARPRYDAILKKVTDYKAELTKLPELKVADILNAVDGNTIIVMGPTTAKVIPSADLFQSAATATNRDRAAFTGEQAVSSALLAMTHPDKVKVVFVTAAPAQLLTTQYTEVSKLLTQYNFEPLEWSPTAAPTPGDPNPPAAPTPPPAAGKGVVWVIFPPEAPSEQMMMMGMQPPNPAPLVAAVKAHLAAGGRAMFLAEAGNSMMGAGGGYAFASILKDYGIAVQDKYTVVEQADQQDPDSGQLIHNVMPIIDIDRFPDTKITSSLQSMRTRFVPVQAQQGYTGFPTVVSKMADVPAGVDAQVIVETPKGPDFWGETEFKEDSKFDVGVDLAGPVPLAATAVKGTGDAETRIATIGCKVFAADQIMRASQQVLVGSNIVSVQLFPGNGQLFLNTVRWLAGYENMIAVGPKATAAARIRDISPAMLTAIDWGVLYAGAPVLALVIGGCVWFVRRR